MPGPSRRLRRPSTLIVLESLLMAAVLGATSGLASAGSFDPTLGLTGSADPAPSPEASIDPGPSPDTEPSPVTEPSPTPDPTPLPDPTQDPDPTLPPEPGPLPAPSAEPSTAPDPSVAPEPSAEPAATPGVHVDHVWVDTIDRRTGNPQVGLLDEPAGGVARGTLYVVRFQVLNDSDTAVELQPAIEFGAGVAPDSWTLVPAVDPVDGVALYSSSNVRRGQKAGVHPIGVGGLRLGTSADPAATAQVGLTHDGVNPGRRLTLDGHRFTELAFTVRATADAPWLATFRLRLSSDGLPLAGTGIATLTLRDSPPVVLSPGQRSGIPVADPIPAYALEGDTAAAGPGTKVAVGLNAPNAPSFESPHGPYTLIADECAACHSTHTAVAPPLLVRPAPQSAMCFTCHDGTGADSDVAAQYDDPSVPANDPSTGSYYSHPATTLSSHTTGGDEGEFAGVLNRHAACADCHSPHRADASLSIETTAGWTTSGALVGASGVEVVNGAAASPPDSYTWLASATLEYQVCFKCHSGFTELNPQVGGPSTWALDKAVELNPANLSYHPVEAPGTNGTAQMTRSLSGTSPYKLWIFTTASTVRCLNCHGDSRLANPASPPAAGARLAPHAVPNRGMLIEPLRDRLLKGSSAAYAAADFALCYACHAEAPFVDTSQNARLDTRFPLHGTHTAAIAAFTGAAGTIDDDGAGHGNALCAECHFRTHGTTYAVDGQAPATRLVNFAPNVQPYQGSNPLYAGQLSWNAGTQSCTLTCHGVDHAAWSY